MQTKDLLLSFCQYYVSTRGEGHSYVAINGLKSSEDAIFIVGFNHLKGMNGTDPSRCVSVGEFPTKMIGKNVPIVFDNYALRLIFEDAHDRIVKLEKENESLNNKLRIIKEILR